MQNDTKLLDVNSRVHSVSKYVFVSTYVNHVDYYIRITITNFLTQIGSKG